MAIAFVQSVGFQGDNVNSVNAVLNGVAAGNFLAVQASAYLSGTGPPNTAPSDDKGNTWNTTTAPTTTVEAAAHIFYAQNVASGNTTLTVDYGTGFFVTGEFSEFSGVETTGALDQQTQNNASSTTPTTGSTGTLAQADELVLAATSVNGGTANDSIDVPATTGYTNVFVEQDSSAHIAGAGDYKIVSSTAAQSAAWGTLGGAYGWTAKIATFKAAAASGPTITAQPADATIYDGETANFSVTATSSGGTLTYQWQVDTGSGFNNVSDGSGATSSSYTTATKSVNDSGDLYRCVVSDDNGSTNTNSATLTVNAAARISWFRA